MAEADLGNLIAVFSARRGRYNRGIGWILGVLGGLAVIAIAAWGSWEVYQAYYYHGPAVIGRSIILPAGMALLAAFVAFLGFSLALGKRGETIRLFEGGITIQDHTSENTWRWEEVISIRVAVTRRFALGFATGAVHSYTLVRKNGQRLVMDENLRDVERLAEAIREKVAPMLYAQYAPEFENGGEFVFGPILVSQARGVVINQKTLPWGRVRQASIGRGALSLAIVDENGRSSELKVPVEQIPNPDVLLALMQARNGS
ncbi:MAG: hypothetical protein PHQ40_12915 [Anaerolineaceae bacterium]|nr:hypothetical protein [Anaerolineaceae bacterium]